ncbi:unnamed protein product [Pedinophyceae sp. YPF-701]|nr:unnamed protein product [Pedinophyceae sp. YPF-701]
MESHRAFEPEKVAQGSSLRPLAIESVGPDLLASFEDCGLALYSRIPPGETPDAVSPAATTPDKSPLPANIPFGGRALAARWAEWRGPADLPGAPRWRLRATQKAATRRPARQLVCAGTTIGLVLALTADGVLPLRRRESAENVRFDCADALPGTKGAQCIAWDRERQTLAVAVRRSLLVFHPEAVLEPAAPGDAAHPSGGPLTENWTWAQRGAVVEAPDWIYGIEITGDAVCMALKRELCLLDLGTKHARAVRVPNYRAPSSPSATTVSAAGDLYVAVDDKVYAMTPRGRLLRVCAALPEPVLAVACRGPFLLAVTASAVEVRNRDPALNFARVQTVPLPGGTAANAPPAVSRADAGTLSVSVALPGLRGALHLHARPAIDQVRDLARVRSFDLARAFLSFLDWPESVARGEFHAGDDGAHGPLRPDGRGDGDDPAAGGDAARPAGAVVHAGVRARGRLEKALEMMQGYHFLCAADRSDGAGSPEDQRELGLHHLCTASLPDPRPLLAVFPALLPSGMRDEIHSDLVAVVDSMLEGLGTLASFTCAADAPNAPVWELARALSAHDHKELLRRLLPYLHSFNSRLKCKELAQARFDGYNSASSSSGAASDSGRSGEDAARPVLLEKTFTLGALEQELSRGDLLGTDDGWACLVDTAILGIMLDLGDAGGLLRFVRGPNCASPADCVAALAGRGLYSELIEVYRQRREHRRALSLLRTLAEEPAALETPPTGPAACLAGMPGVWATVRYVLTVRRQLHRRELLDASAWILQRDREAGLEMLLSLDPEIPPPEALLHLRAHAPALCLPYLEAAVARGTASRAAFDTELAFLYVRRLSGPHGDSDGDADGGVDAPEARRRLQALLMASPHVDLAQTMTMLHAPGMAEERAIVLLRTGRHDQGLKELVYGLGDPRAAERWADVLFQQAVLRHRGGDSGARAGGGADAPRTPSPPRARAARAGGVLPDEPFAVADATAANVQYLHRMVRGTATTMPVLAHAPPPASPAEVPRRNGAIGPAPPPVKVLRVAPSLLVGPAPVELDPRRDTVLAAPWFGPGGGLSGVWGPTRTCGSTWRCCGCTWSPRTRRFGAVWGRGGLREAWACRGSRGGGWRRSRRSRARWSWCGTARTSWTPRRWWKCCPGRSRSSASSRSSTRWSRASRSSAATWASSSVCAAPSPSRPSPRARASRRSTSASPPSARAGAATSASASRRSRRFPTESSSTSRACRRSNRRPRWPWPRPRRTPRSAAGRWC